MNNESSPSAERKAELLLLIVVVIWASNFPLAKFGIQGLDIFLFNGIRYVSAFLVMIVLFRLRFTWQETSSGDWLKMIGVGFLANVVYQLAFIIGLKFTTAGNSAILLATSPLWTAFWNARLHKEAVERTVWFGMGLSLVGIVLIITGSGRAIEFGSRGMIGDIVSLAAAMLWALNTNFQKPLLTTYSTMQLSVIMVAVGAAVHALLALPDALTVPWQTSSPTYLLVGVISGVLSIGVANVLWSHGVKRLGPSRTANMSNLTPVLAFVISYLTLDEQISWLHVVGGAVTLLGVWIVRR
jgi:drug/metabolite transporter (DMT)-like permease